MPLRSNPDSCEVTSENKRTGGFMPTKQGLDQHNILHQHFPNNCCLCRLEAENARYKAEIEELKKENLWLC
jgi:hypothetical protein